MPNETKSPGNPDKSTIAVDITPFDRFHALLTYREQIRTLIIENQLDDRHDLRGNSLYRLRFDAAVLPGSDTSSNAKIIVSVLPPEALMGDSALKTTEDLRKEESRLANLTHLSQLTSGSQLSVWNRIYARWLDSLEKRFEDARKALRKAYDTNRFAPEDYDLLLDSVRSGTHVWFVQIELDEWFTQRPLYQDQEQELTRLVEKLSELKLDRQTLGQDRELLKSIIKGASAESTLGSAQSGQDSAIAQFHTAYFQGIAEPSDAAHPMYKDEINQLIEVINRERTLSAHLEYILHPPENPSLVTVQNDEACKSLQAYGTQAIVVAPEQYPEQYVELNLRYYMDRAFEGKLAKSVLGLELEPSQPSDTGTKLKNLKALVQLAATEAKFGAIGPAFKFTPQNPSLVVTDSNSCLPKTIDTITDGVRQSRVYSPQRLGHLTLSFP